MKQTEEIALALEESGVDILEIGVPFSDPTADGPIIQEASQRALKKGTTLAGILDMVAALRQKSEIPIVLFSYYNPIFSFGVEEFAQRASRAGVDGVLVVDLPWEESAELKRVTDPLGIRFIYLIAPTSGEERVRAIAAKASGFLYYISVTGVTGTQLPVADGIEADVANIRKYAQVPIAVGFGISNAATAREIAGKVDGIVIGSAIMKIIAEDRGGDLVKKIREFASEVSKGVSGA
jgi:tryptophan synthase alpha chain